MPALFGRGGVRVGRVFGIPIFVHPSWLVIFGLIAWTLATGYFPAQDPDLPVRSYWARALFASVLFFASILLHELGHSLVARRHGIGIQSITLFVFGGVAHMARDPRDGRTELKIAAAGPAVSFALALLFLGVSRLPLVGGATSAVTRYLALINLGVGVFNLVPAFPLDGGRLLRGLLWRRVGKAGATRMAARAGTVFAWFLIVSGVLSLVRGDGISGMWYVLIGWFLKDASAAAYRDVHLDELLAGVTVGEAMVRDVVTLPADISLAQAAQEHFLRDGYGGYPVLRGSQVVGLLCLRDVLRYPMEERETTSVQGAMLPLGPDLVVGPEVPLLKATARMAEAGTGRLLVMEGDRLVGLLTLRAVLRQVQVREELK
ncbi:MAG TPA: site-2 protease family protein [Vicinamibacteria bacterium]|jgi:Zn-dependent protease/predicted transcriptional regulator